MAAALTLTAIGGAMADGPERPCAYSVLTVPAPICPFWGPRAPTPLGVNNLGNWVGIGKNCAAFADYAIRWTPETGIVPLPVSPGTSVSAAYGINDLGTAVGHHGYRACAWSAEGVFELLQVTTAGSSCSAEAINNAGVVVGWKYDTNVPGVMMSFVWSAGATTDINPITYGHVRAEAKDISDSGYVCGDVDGDWMGRGFRWRDGVLDVLEPLPGALGCMAFAINDAGVAVGDSHFFLEDGETHSHHLPTMWIGTQAIPLPLLPGYTSGSAKDVNGMGVILSTGLVSPPGGYGVWILTPKGVVADLTNDCTVDGADLAVLLEAWGPRRAGHPADLDGDGRVSEADLGLLLAKWTLP